MELCHPLICPACILGPVDRRQGRAPPNDTPDADPQNEVSIVAPLPPRAKGRRRRVQDIVTKLKFWGGLALVSTWLVLLRLFGTGGDGDFP
jgi:hypothetical protein